jgi:hypothetical protein
VPDVVAPAPATMSDPFPPAALADPDVAAPVPVIVWAPAAEDVAEPLVAAPAPVIASDPAADAVAAPDTAAPAPSIGAEAWTATEKTNPLCATSKVIVVEYDPDDETSRAAIAP